MSSRNNYFHMYDVYVVQTLDRRVQFEMLINSTQDDWMQRIQRWKDGV